MGAEYSRATTGFWGIMRPMTTPEHTFVGIHLALSLGWQRTIGWPAVVLAGVASNVPDWDGLPMLVDMARHEAGHRVWGHNLLAIAIASVLLAWSQSRFGWCDWIVTRIGRMTARTGTDAVPGAESNTTGLVAAGVAGAAQLVHLPCDMVVSGGHGLPDWPIQPLWPFSHQAFVAPLVPWGDVGPTVILMAGAIWGAKQPARLSRVSMTTLACLALYLVGRGWARGMIGS